METNKTSKSKTKSKTSKSKTSKSKTSLKKQQMVRFNNYIESRDETSDDFEQSIYSDLDNSDNDNSNNDNSDNENVNDSDQIIEHYSDLNIQKDPTDIYDSDEGEINEEANDIDNFLNNELAQEEYAELIKYIYNLFLDKHVHLDNFRNRAIILKLCTMAVNSMPEHIANPIFYLNFIESSINHLKNMTTEDIEKISKEDDIN